MLYTIDIVEHIFTTKRLKKDGTFQDLEKGKEIKVLDDDFVFQSYHEAKEWKRKQTFIEIDGEKIEVNPESYGLTDSHVDIRPHRTGKPSQEYFTEDDLISLIAKGDDRIANSLVVDFDGFLHLVPFEQAKNGPYAVRFETFQAGNGYVGSEKAVDYLTETYLSLLEGWLSHLISHDMEYRDGPSSRNKEELLIEIKKTIAEL